MREERGAQRKKGKEGENRMKEKKEKEKGRKYDNGNHKPLTIFSHNR